MQLQLSSWPEVERYLQTSSGIIIPIGSTEQHGPTGFIGTDALCPEIVASGIAKKTGAMIAPTLSIGMAQHHLGFPGSITLRPSTLMAVIRDVVHSLSQAGFTRFFFLNGHGGNIATANAAFAEIYAQYSLGLGGTPSAPMRCILKNWWDSKEVLQLAKEEFGNADGSHATASEVALTYFGYPDDAARVRSDSKLDPEIAPRGSFTDAANYRETFLDGRIGSDPTLASEDIGRRLRDAAVTGLAEVYREFIAT